MCKNCTAHMQLPEMLYEGPQKVCTQCQGGMPASRHIDKVPRAARSNKKPKAVDAAADAAVQGAKQAFGAAKNFFGKKK